MSCYHSTRFAYTLSLPDHKDICKRLGDTNIQVGSLLDHSNYLTPCSLRYSHRKSMLATTKTTKSSDGDHLSVPSPSAAGQANLLEGDGKQFTKFSVKNSGGRSGRNHLMIPQQFFNCADCGAIIMHVSKVTLLKLI